MIKGPKNAIPTTKGWRHETSGELLKAAKLSQAMIDEWYGVTVEPAAPEPEPEPAPEPEPVEEVVEVEDLLVDEEEHTPVEAPKKKRRWGLSTK